jgi:hypothetical protein
VIFEIAFAAIFHRWGAQLAQKRPARRRHHIEANDQEPDALSQRPVPGVTRQGFARIQPMPEGIAIALGRAASTFRGGGHRRHHELFLGNWRGVPPPGLLFRNRGRLIDSVHAGIRT